MRRYKLGAHTKTDLKVHLIWIPKYRKRVLTGQVAIRARDLLRQIALEHELDVISGKIASDHVHMFIGHRKHKKEYRVASTKV
jgi:putative transposase